MSQQPPTIIVIAFDSVGGKLASTLRTDLSVGLRHDHRGIARAHSMPHDIRLVLTDAADNADIVIKHPTDSDTAIIKRIRVGKGEVTKEKFFSIRRRFQEPVVVLIPVRNKDLLSHVATLHGEVLAAATKIARRKQPALTA